ncbi:hypothetical protein BH11MYX3_BH11MYX3_40360 [soil metagenome]
MKVAKHVLILLGLAGLVGVFMPLAELRKGPVGVTLSAKELSFGLEKTHGLLDRKLPSFAERRLPGVVRDTRDDVKLVADYLKWAVLVFAPCAVLALIGVIALKRGRLGRVLAGGSLVFGVIELGAWIGLHYAIDYALVEADVKGMTIQLMPGAHMLLIGAAAGIGVGLACLIRPEPRTAQYS